MSTTQKAPATPAAIPQLSPEQTAQMLALVQQLTAENATLKANPPKPAGKPAPERKVADLSAAAEVLTGTPLGSERTFSSGNTGYYAGGKIMIDGARYQVTCNIVKIKAK